MMIFKRLVGVPVIGTLLAVCNSYVSGGAFDSDVRAAPVRTWIVVFGPPLLLAGFLTAIVASDCTIANWWPKCVMTSSVVFLRGGEIAAAILPNVLGFGIGVYALVFALSPGFLKAVRAHMAKSKRTTSGPATILAFNADMAFPLLVLIGTLGISLLQQRFPSISWLQVGAWFCLWYSLLVSLDLIGTLFRLGEVVLLNKLDEPDSRD